MLTESTTQTLYDDATLPQGQPEQPWSRLQIIEAIEKFAPSTPIDFLEGFSDRRLKSYLDHLRWGCSPRGTSDAWGDPDATAAIGCAEPLD
ncbi:MAG: hypothetical protein AABZ53_16810 [Planctomycetota bacterium]